MTSAASADAFHLVIAVTSLSDDASIQRQYKWYDVDYQGALPISSRRDNITNSESSIVSTDNLCWFPKQFLLLRELYIRKLCDLVQLCPVNFVYFCAMACDLVRSYCDG